MIEHEKNVGSLVPKAMFRPNVYDAEVNTWADSYLTFGENLGGKTRELGSPNMTMQSRLCRTAGLSHL